MKRLLLAVILFLGLSFAGSAALADHCPFGGGYGGGYGGFGRPVYGSYYRGGSPGFYGRSYGYPSFGRTYFYGPRYGSFYRGGLYFGIGF